MGGTGRVDAQNSQWKIEQVIECLTDPKTYFFAAISVLTQVCHLVLTTIMSTDVETDTQRRHRQLRKPCSQEFWLHKLAINPRHIASISRLDDLNPHNRLPS